MTTATNGRLSGRRILVTRTRERAAGLVDALQGEGGEAVVVPLLTTTPLADPEAVRASFHSTLESPHAWAVFTSATAVRLVLGAVEPELFATVKVAAVGAETAAALRAAGVPVAMTGDAGAAALADALAGALVAGVVPVTPVWFPAAEGAGTELEERLRAAGAPVTRLALYRTDMPEDAPRRLAVALRRPVDAVTLTSGSAVHHLVRALGDTPLDTVGVAACLGATAADAARGQGFADVVVAPLPTLSAVLDVLVQRLGAAQPVR